MKYATRNAQLELCLSIDRAPETVLDRELQVAGEAGFACIEMGAPALETYLARHPVVWLDLQMRQHGIHSLVIGDLAPISILGGAHDEDALVDQTRFLELCTHLDTLGGATIVLRPAAGREQRGDGLEGTLRGLRAYADLAAPFEVIVAFEFKADSAVPTLKAAYDLVTRAAKSNLRLSLSTHEWCTTETELCALDGLAGQLALAHVDSLLSPPSQPASATEPSPTPDEPALTVALCKHLVAAGFRGPFCLSRTPDSGAFPEPGTSLERARAARQAALEVLAPLFTQTQAP